MPSYRQPALARPSRHSGKFMAPIIAIIVFFPSLHLSRLEALLTMKTMQLTTATLCCESHSVRFFQAQGRKHTIVGLGDVSKSVGWRSGHSKPGWAGRDAYFHASRLCAIFQLTRPLKGDSIRTQTALNFGINEAGSDTLVVEVATTIFVLK